MKVSKQKTVRSSTPEGLAGGRMIDVNCWGALGGSLELVLGFRPIG